MGLMVLHRAVQNRGARFAGVESETSYEDRMQKQCPDCPKCLPVMLNDSPKCRSGCPKCVKTRNALCSMTLQSVGVDVKNKETDSSVSVVIDCPK